MTNNCNEDIFFAKIGLILSFLGITMKPTNPLLNSLVMKSTENTVTSILGTRVGRITDINFELKTVFVDFEGNPLGKPIPAKLGRPYLMDDLKKALDNVQDIRLDFEGNNPSYPIINDIYYSVFDSKEKDDDLLEKEIYIKAKRLVLEGTQEIIIKSGSASSRYIAKNGKLIEEAKYISSHAIVTNKIKGGNLTLN